MKNTFYIIICIVNGKPEYIFTELSIGKII